MPGLRPHRGIGTRPRANPEPSCGLKSQWQEGSTCHWGWWRWLCGQTGAESRAEGGVEHPLPPPQATLPLVTAAATVTIQDLDFLFSLPVFLLSLHLLDPALSRHSSVPVHSALAPPLCSTCVHIHPVALGHEHISPSRKGVLVGKDQLSSSCSSLCCSGPEREPSASRLVGRGQ